MNGERPIRSRSWVLGVLTLVYMVNFIDRQVLPILLQPIKEEFHVSDAVLGLLAGPTFALFYALMGIPLALLADRSNRRRLIAASLALFSLMTIACGFAQRFWQLALFRIGTGIGEAGTGPASQTIIADLYTGTDRARAQATYAVGNNAGILVAFASGGVIAEQFGWRWAFVLAGAPGLLLVFVVLTTLGDVPRRRRNPGAGIARHSLVMTAKTMWAVRTLRWTALGASSTCFTAFAIATFYPAFLERSHQMGRADIGVTLALIVGVGGATVTFLAGIAADRLSLRDVRWMLWVPAIAAAIGLPLAPLALLSSDRTVAIAAAIPSLVVTVAFVGPVIVVVQQLVPDSMRAIAVATLILVDNLIGLGLGPQFVGLISDALAPYAGQDSLRWALLAAMCGYVLAIMGFVLAARSMPVDCTKSA